MNCNCAAMVSRGQIAEVVPIHRQRFDCELCLLEATFILIVMLAGWPFRSREFQTYVCSGDFSSRISNRMAALSKVAASASRSPAVMT
jgi:hypothetical protein